ncbi:MAG: hypothetical protein H0U44_04120 [Flavisolibacter sp.]|nr:hypothetical protein [Flavisolibacter sp.]
MKKIPFLLLTILFMAFLSSCTKCDPDFVCTQEFRSIIVNLQNAEGHPVVLDEAYTQRAGSTQNIVFSQPMNDGSYVVLDDSYHSSLVNSEADFHFIGKKNNQVVVNQIFRIAADQCHINKKTGPETIVVN